MSYVIFTALLFSHIAVLFIGWWMGQQINIPADVAMSKQTKAKKGPRHEMKPDIYEEERIDVS